MLVHLATNRTEPVYDQTEDEVLKRTLNDIMAGVDQDDETPTPGEPQKHYHTARLAAATNSDVTQRTDIRKLLYSSTLPFTLGTLMRLGDPFSHSRFLNLIFLKDLQKIHAGVSDLAPRPTAHYHIYRHV